MPYKTHGIGDDRSCWHYWPYKQPEVWACMWASELHNAKGQQWRGRTLGTREGKIELHDRYPSLHTLLDIWRRWNLRMRGLAILHWYPWYLFRASIFGVNRIKQIGSRFLDIYKLLALKFCLNNAEGRGLGGFSIVIVMRDLCPWKHSVLLQKGEEVTEKILQYLIYSFSLYVRLRVVGWWKIQFDLQ